MLQKVGKYIQSGFDYYLLKTTEQLKYELEMEVRSLQKAYDESHSNWMWENLQLKRKELDNVSARLAEKRIKSDQKKDRTSYSMI